jgi:hypothetical protein
MPVTEVGVAQGDGVAELAVGEDMSAVSDFSGHKKAAHKGAGTPPIFPGKNLKTGELYPVFRASYFQDNKNGRGNPQWRLISMWLGMRWLGGDEKKNRLTGCGMGKFWGGLGAVAGVLREMQNQRFWGVCTKFSAEGFTLWSMVEKWQFTESLMVARTRVPESE